MTLADFILKNMEKILSEWQEFAETLPPTVGMNKTALRDEARGMLETIAHDMPQAQSGREQEEKSKGGKPRSGAKSFAELHANDRQREGFDINQLVAEFRALRASVIRLWIEDMKTADVDTLYQSTRFNEAMDQALIESIAEYARELDRSRELFMGVLGHDLRSPLGAVSMSAQYLLSVEGLPVNATKAASRIFHSAGRMKQMISDLLDVTRTRLGGALPIEKQPMDLHEVCAQLVEEAKAFHPDQTILLHASGDLQGTWDPGRLSQMLSNLVGNAVQHGKKETLVTVSAIGDEHEVILSVHNEGAEIPKSSLKRIFEPLVREDGENRHSTGLGLGLYIAQCIAKAHGGTIDAASSGEMGTVFKVCLPKSESQQD